MNNHVYQYAALIEGTSAAGTTQTARIFLGGALIEEAGGRVTAHHYMVMLQWAIP